MAENEKTALRPGQSECRDRGQRLGCSARGRLVQLRRRVVESGYVVTVDVKPPEGVSTEVITSDWGTANAAFDRYMRQY